MLKKHLGYYFDHLDKDIPAGLVVFLIALPLCLGIALASGAPPFSGVIAGVVGGLVVSLASGSQLSVSGPAAGLTAIVLAAVQKQGFDSFLVSLVVAGLLQIALGYVRAGVIGAFFPASVIKGMLAAIGLILIMKQLPHAVGYDAEADADLSFLEEHSHSPYLDILQELAAFSPGAVVVSAVSLAILLAWETERVRSKRWLTLVPGPLVAVIFGVLFNLFTARFVPFFAIAPQHLVSLPIFDELSDFGRQMTFPNFGHLLDIDVYVTAGTLALIGSLETLLSLEAVDKLDPLKRIAPTNRELKAQGLGNLISGLLGGLPITAVIVRSSANVNAGARTKVASFVHGVLLLLCALFLAQVLNLIPLASLAAVLLLTGFKLAKPDLFKEIYAKGLNQFIPFVVTVVAILATDLLKGMAIGMAVGVYYVLRGNYHAAITLTRDGSHYLLRLQKDVSFLNKALLRRLLMSIDAGGYLIVDGSKASFIDQDILETLEDFIHSAEDANIRIELKSVRGLKIDAALLAGARDAPQGAHAAAG